MARLPATPHTLACGENAIVTNDYGVALGSDAGASGGSTAVGANSTASESPVPIVLSAFPPSDGDGDATALGFTAIAFGNGTLAVGDHAIVGIATPSGTGVQIAPVNNGTAIGSGAIVTGADGTALGKGAAASAANSVAIGTGSVADQADTVSVGAAGDERRVVNVAAGVGDTDAVNVSQLNAALAAIPDFDPTILQDQLDGLQGQVAGLQGQVDGLTAQQHHDRLEARRGIAAAVAMSEAPMPSRDGGISYSLHGAGYRGQYAIGGSMKYRINRSVAIDFGVSSAGHKDTAVRLGVSGEF